MRAILLNPPKKSKRGRKSRRVSGRTRYTKSCLRQVRRRSAWKRFHKLWGAKKAAKATAAATKSADPFGYAGLVSRNPRRKHRSRRRNDAGSTWIPCFRNSRGRRHRRNATFNYGTAFTRRNDGGSTWLPSFRNPYWVPRYATNPGFVGALTKPFQPKLLLGMTPYVGGALGNAILSTWLRNLSFMPQMLKSGIGGSVVNLASAGILGAGVGLISPKLAGPVFMGGVVDAVISVVNEYLKPMLGLKGCAGCDAMSGYLTVADAANALPLGGMQEYLTTADAANAQALGDLEDTYSLPDLPSDVASYSPVAFV